MKKFLIGILLVLILVGAGFGSYYVTYEIKKPTEEDVKEKICKIYYLDRIEEEKNVLTYYTKKIDLTTDIATQANELITILQRGHDNGYSSFPLYAEVLSVELVENTLKLNLNDQFFVLQPDSDRLKDIAIDCLVDTLIQLKGIHNIQIVRNGETVEKFGTKDLTAYQADNVEAYQVESHANDKLPSYLKVIPYINKSEKQIFTSTPNTWAAKEVTVDTIEDLEDSYTVKYKIAGKSKVKTPVMPKSYEEEWKIKEDGLYINDVKYLDKGLYVGNSWEVDNFVPLLNATTKNAPESYNATFKVSDVIYKEENGQIVKDYEIEVTVPDLVTKTSATYIENLTFREGQGIYKRNIIDPTATVHTRLDVDVDTSTDNENEKD